MKDLFTWADAKARGELGMTRAVEHADDVDPSWSDLAGAALLAYARGCGGAFIIEDVREWAVDVPEPPDRRAWGAVVRRAALAGAIVRVGYQPAKSSNLSPKCLWRVA